MSATTTRSAARETGFSSVKRTASTRASRASARANIAERDADVEDSENDVDTIKAKVAAKSKKDAGRKTKSNKSANVDKQAREDAENNNVTTQNATQQEEVKKQPQPPPTTKLSTKAASILHDVVKATTQPPLSPSKSFGVGVGGGAATRLPLSPVKRHNGNPPSSNHSGFSPPKMMKNDENVASPRKMGFSSPIRRGGGGAPPQSPIRAGPPQSPVRRIQSLCGNRMDTQSVTPRSLFSDARSKSSSCSSSTTSSSSSSFSKPLRTSCHPPSPLKSPPPTMKLVNSILGGDGGGDQYGSNIPLMSPLKSPVSVKRSDLFASSDQRAVDKNNPRPPSIPTTSRPINETASNVMLSPKTPRAADVVVETSPSKPTTSPAKPPPSSKVPPSSPPTTQSSSTSPPPKTASSPSKTGASSKSSPPLPAPPLGSSPTSPAESRLARLNLNAAPSPYAAARKAFHTATPAGQIKGREAEKKEIVDFIEDHFKGNKSGALYVSGAPGTGKTATLNTIINEYKATTKCVTIYINCMSVRNSSLIYGKILAEGSSSKTPSAPPKGGAKGAQKAVEKLVTTKGKPILLFLDEMDQLGDVNNQDVLYTLFEWTFTPGSRLVMVGVANALDLTERILPRLQAKAQRKPRTMNFAPYSQAQLLDILSHRLSTSSTPSSSADPSSPAPPALVDTSALLFCAKKIAAVSGDARKALDACRYAVEMVEKSSAESTPSVTSSTTPFSTPGSSAATPSAALPPKKVGITHVMRVLSGVYENAAVATSATPKAANASAGSNSGGGTLTLQQKIIICCLVLIHKKGKNTKVVSVGKLQEVYKKVCQRKGFIPGMSEAGGGDLAEFLSILSNIEASGILTIKKEKVSRDSKVNLLLDEKELEKALQDDRKLLATILQSDII